MTTTGDGEKEPRILQSNGYVERKVLDAIDDIFRLRKT
jgi:hypothetical protein